MGQEHRIFRITVVACSCSFDREKNQCQHRQSLLWTYRQDVWLVILPQKTSEFTVKNHKSHQPTPSLENIRFPERAITYLEQDASYWKTPFITELKCLCTFPYLHTTFWKDIIPDQIKHTLLNKPAKEIHLSARFQFFPLLLNTDAKLQPICCIFWGIRSHQLSKRPFVRRKKMRTSIPKCLAPNRLYNPNRKTSAIFGWVAPCASLRITRPRSFSNKSWHPPFRCHRHISKSWISFTNNLKAL